jgi:phage terminase large subunit-like protein
MGVPIWTTSCLDWEERIVKGMSLIPFEPLFPDQAAEALAVFDSLRMVDAAGAPYLSEVSRAWIREFVAHIFGSYEKETGIRHINEFFMLISKKNGKSTDAAAIMVIMLVLNWRLSAELIILSPTVEIAGNSFKPAADMVRIDPELSELLMVQDHIRTITHRVTGATLKVVAADSDTVGGKKASCVLIDELWLLGKRVGAENMLREAMGGLASRPEGFVIYLTTQSDEPPAGVFKQKLEYARGVRDGKIDDPQFLPVIYEYPDHMLKAKAYLDPKNFYLTNPNITDPDDPSKGGSVDAKFLLRKFKQAQIDGEETMRGYLAKHHNVQIGLNLSGDRWPGADYWEGAKRPTPVSLAYLIANCEVITAGIDGGGLDDLLGFCALGRTKLDELVVTPAHFDEENQWIPEQRRMMKRWLSFEYAWAHPSVMTRRKDIATMLQDFKKAGEMTLVDFIGQDVEELAQMVWQLEESGLLCQVGLDPNAIGGILDAILAAGVPLEKLVSVNQGYRLAGSIKTTERKLAEGVIAHSGTSLMNWNVGNAKIKVVGNAIVVTKQVSGTAKIDCLIALFNAVSLMALNPPSQLPDFDFSLMVIGG